MLIGINGTQHSHASLNVKWITNWF